MAAKSMQCNEAERQRILDAAVTLFADSGYAGATMGRIAVSAGCSVGHLYSHFSSKQSLLEELTTRFFRRLNQALDAVEAAPMRSPLSHYRMRLQALARELGRDHRLVAVVLGEEAMLRSLARRHVALMRERDQALLGAAMEAGELPALDPQLLLAAMEGMIRALAALLAKEAPEKLGELGSLLDAIVITPLVAGTGMQHYEEDGRS